MIWGNNSNHKTQYEILGVNEDASSEEIRTSYRAAILNSHPDKLQKKPEESSDSGDATFLKIQKAWEILGTSKSRALYDSQLRSSRQDIEDAFCAEEVGLEDLIVEDAGDDDCVELLYRCRCGDYFSIDSVELREMGYPISREGSNVSLQNMNSALPASVVLACGSCSLKLKLVLQQSCSNS